MKKKKADGLLVAFFLLAITLGGAACFVQIRRIAGVRTGEHEPFIKSQTALARSISRSEAERAGLSLHEALFYEKIGKGAVRCTLCPKGCTLLSGERGICKVRANFGGVLYSLVYNRVVACHIDPIEKKPLFHFTPGERALSIATAGCNLGCTFCQNWSISQSHPEDTRFAVLTPEDIVSLAVQHGCSAIAYTYSEPTIFYEFMLDCAKRAHDNGIKNVWITSGYINPAPLKELVPLLDAANVDLKGIRDEYYHTYCEGSVAPVLETLKTLKEEGVHLEITNLILPGANDSEEDIRDLAAWISDNIGEDAVVHFSRYFPAYKMQSPPTPLKTLLKARDIAHHEGLSYVYIGNYPGQGLENTYCSRCGALLVRRIGYSIIWEDYRIRQNRCPECGERIYGVWK
jgi:pyruvate formate lyase activating enzyme